MDILEALMLWHSSYKQIVSDEMIMNEPLWVKSVQPTALSRSEGFPFSWSAANLFLSHSAVW